LLVVGADAAVGHVDLYLQLGRPARSQPYRQHVMDSGRHGQAGTTSPSPTTPVEANPAVYPRSAVLGWSHHTVPARAVVAS
jgi:hypothetical protein